MEGITYIAYGKEGYPKRLEKLEDHPKGLYIKGRLPSDEAPAIAVVGARMCSPYGKEMALIFGRELAAQGVQIISGLARGIDGWAQQGALEGNGRTYAVLGCGADICYPREHERLYREIQKCGGIISEYPPGDPPAPWHFPARNRIISGLADLVLVIEAREKSGSLITADMALEQGRDVYAVPGRIGDALSAGCNRLIAQGAGIALSPGELLRQLGIFTARTEPEMKKNNYGLEKKEVSVYACLDLVPKNLETIAEITALPIEDLFEVLLSLQLKGYAKEVSKGRFVKCGIE